MKSGRHHRDLAYLVRRTPAFKSLRQGAYTPEVIRHLLACSGKDGITLEQPGCRPVKDLVAALIARQLQQPFRSATKVRVCVILHVLAALLPDLGEFQDVQHLRDQRGIVLL